MKLTGFKLAIWTVFFSLLFLGVESFAQSRSGKYHRQKSTSRHMSNFTQKVKYPAEKRYLAFGGGIGMTNYFGDLTPKTSALSTDLRMTRWQFSGFVEKKMNYNISLRAGIQFVRLAGSDFRATNNKNDEYYKYTWARNLHFRNDIIEASLVGIFDLYSSTSNHKNRHPLTPYGLLGVAAFYHNPKAIGPVGTEDAGKWTALHSIKTEPNKEYSRFQIAIPVGLGIRYRATHQIDIGVELAYRFTFTDYLDDVSDSYYDKEDIMDPEKLSDPEFVKALRFSNRTLETNKRGDFISWINGDEAIRNDEDIRGVVGKGGQNIIEVPVPGSTPYAYINGTAGGESPRGNKNDNDHYYITNFTVRYIMPSQKHRKPKYR